MTKLSISLIAAGFAVVAAPALAADLPRGVVEVPAPAAAAAPTTTISFEASPEFYALASSSHDAGTLADWYGKGSISHNFGSGFSGSLAFQDTVKPATSAFLGGLNQQYYEGALAYKLAVVDNLSFTVTGTLGYTTGNTGFFGGIPVSGAADQGNSDDGYFYYAIAGALDYKLDPHWTWNVINARYRNAFDRTWQTPKIATGLTYNIDSTNAVYANVGYSWKDTGTGYNADKLNVAVGYKYSF